MLRNQMHTSLSSWCRVYRCGGCVCLSEVRARVQVMDVDCGGIKQQTPKPSDGNIEAVCDFFNE